MTQSLVGGLAASGGHGQVPVSLLEPIVDLVVLDNGLGSVEGQYPPLEIAGWNILEQGATRRHELGMQTYKNRGKEITQALWTLPSQS